MNNAKKSNSGANFGCRFLIIFLIILSLLSILPTISSAAIIEDAPPPYPEQGSRQIAERELITIQLHEEGEPVIKPALVGPGDLRTITFEGEIFLYKQYPGQNFDQVLVTLDAEIEDEGWVALPKPRSLIFRYGDVGPRGKLTENFTLMVVAPFRAPLKDHTVTVTGNYMTSPAGRVGEIEPATVKVTVVNFQDLLLVSLDPLKTVSPGATVEFKLQVENRGNYEDSYIIELMNEDQLANMDWSVELRQSTLENVPSWGVKNITIKVYAPQRFTIWKNQVTPILVRVTSQSALGSKYEGFAIKEYSLFVYERGVYYPPEPTICIIIFLIIIIVSVVWYRKYTYKKWKKKQEEEGEK